MGCIRGCSLPRKTGTSIELCGVSLPSPIFMAPIGVLGPCTGDGDLHCAEASVRTGVPFFAGTLSADPMEDVAKTVRRPVGHRHQVVAAEPAALTLHTALLVGALPPGPAVERVEPRPGTKLHPPIRLGPVPPEQHSGHGGFQVVVTDLLGRHPAELGERLQVALQKRLLALRAKRPVHRAPTPRAAR
jgi:hypothetical protein